MLVYQMSGISEKKANELIDQRLAKVSQVATTEQQVKQMVQKEMEGILPNMRFTNLNLSDLMLKIQILEERLARLEKP